MNVASQDATYHDELTRAMNWLGQQDDVIFIGQGVGNPGTGLSKSLEQVPIEKRIEFPVAEEMQVGMCVGMSLKGIVPVCIIPRWNFALRAADQIVNHLDRLPIYSQGGYNPRVIIRVAVPSVHPFNPQSQHDADFSEAFKSMLRTVRVCKLDVPKYILPAYQGAFDWARNGVSSIMVEYTDQYRNARAA
jgi:pyruvate/2-oxoglutarate/acetoin dehydrogenase E1 component